MPAAAQRLESVAVIGADYYLVADNPQGGMDIWKSDGTTAGTVLLAVFGAGSEAPIGAPGFVALGARIYFMGFDGSLWQTDGTPAGTSHTFTNGALEDISDLQEFGGALYFFGYLDDWGLWRSDGTLQGTVELQTLGGFPALGGLTPVGNGLAFHANDFVHGNELWFTDGTAAGTRLLSDILPGSFGSEPSSLVAAGGRIFFSADDGSHGAELWTSDGTAAGTRMVQDINPGAGSSSPSDMTAAGGLLFFAADDGFTGRQLWALPLDSAAGCLPSATDLCLSGGRFQVEAFWRGSQGDSGPGQAEPLTGDTGTFWFFSPDDLEVIVKVLDGRALNDHFWVFYGALSNVEYALTVTDTTTGLTRRYLNPPGQLASVGDTTAFGPLGASLIGGPPSSLTSGARGGHLVAAPYRAASQQVSGCNSGPSQLCLNGDRFSVSVAWTDFNGRSGSGTAVPLTTDTGSFWFFDAANIEIVVKVLDGRGLNGHFWLFYGALSDVRYTLTVTDTVSGAVRTYTNPLGNFASVADTSAF
jgi:ELWxxDGT repeat protein